MATIIERDTHRDSGSGVGAMLGIILLVVLAFLILYYGLPALRSGTQVNIPDKINVNINAPGAGK